MTRHLILHSKPESGPAHIEYDSRYASYNDDDDRYGLFPPRYEDTGRPVAGGRFAEINYPDTVGIGRQCQ